MSPAIKNIDGDADPAIAVAQWLTAAYRSGRPFLVGIDGASRAGKSTFAAALAAALKLSSYVVSGEDFYSDAPEAQLAQLGPAAGVEEYFDWRRLRDQVLRPTEHGAQLLHYQQYDWELGALGNWVMVQMPQIVIVEGVYTLRPQLRDLFEATVYVETPAEIRDTRRPAGDEHGQAWITRWEAAEDMYMALTRPDLAADLVVSGA
jgi:uridine kinase